MVVNLDGPIRMGWAILFGTSSHLLSAQVVVVNGLGHFHTWNEPAVGHIVLLNSSNDSLRVLVHTDSLWGVQHPLRIPSEVRMAPKERTSVPYEWFGTDSTSQGLRVFLSSIAEHPATESLDGMFRVKLSTRYAVDLYRGRITDDLKVIWHDGAVHVENSGSDFWAGVCYSLSGSTRGTRRIAGGVLRPGELRVWSVPDEAQGIWLERVDGAVVASLRP